MQINSIVWAFDGSEESQKALKFANFIAKKFKSKIFGISVVETHMYFIFPGADPGIYEIMDRAEKEQKEKFTSLNAELTQQGLLFEGKVVKGESSSEILKHAESMKSDLIVMGTRGHGLLDRLLIGSTTLKVLNNSKIPVLAYRSKDDKELSVNNILVPIEIFEQSDSPIIYALDLARKIDAKITVLNVVSSGVLSYGFPADVVEKTISHSKNEINKIIKNIRKEMDIPGEELDNIIVDIETEHGQNFGSTIIDYSIKKDIDLIVIPTHSKVGVEKLLLGSVTEFVVREAECSVLTLPINFI